MKKTVYWCPEHGWVMNADSVNEWGELVIAKVNKGTRNEVIVTRPIKYEATKLICEEPEWNDEDICGRDIWFTTEVELPEVELSEVELS